MLDYSTEKYIKLNLTAATRTRKYACRVKHNLHISTIGVAQGGEGGGKNATGTNVHIQGGVGDPTWVHYLHHENVIEIIM